MALTFTRPDVTVGGARIIIAPGAHELDLAARACVLQKRKVHQASPSGMPARTVRPPIREARTASQNPKGLLAASITSGCRPCASLTKSRGRKDLLRTQFERGRAVLVSIRQNCRCRPVAALWDPL
jgi:hypothetical protein